MVSRSLVQNLEPAPPLVVVRHVRARRVYVRHPAVDCDPALVLHADTKAFCAAPSSSPSLSSLKSISSDPSSSIVAAAVPTIKAVDLHILPLVPFDFINSIALLRNPRRSRFRARLAPLPIVGPGAAVVLKAITEQGEPVDRRLADPPARYPHLDDAIHALTHDLPVSINLQGLLGRAWQDERTMSAPSCRGRGRMA
ncbi:hypothetical protein A4X06_0g7904 [Tilletia controversa]|uniref:Uncharacterized protein n=1 Tax=Tilletia controversa TaxID=13291 RepID=A0A8X7ML76_9BASI|nr:hypothetical protein A4X06_0g7904 [Tilletia controversa]